MRFDVVVDLASTLRLKGDDDDDDDEDESSCSETSAKLLLFSVDVVVRWCGAPLRVTAWISLPSFVDF